MDPFSDNGAGRRALGAGRSNRRRTLLLVAGSLVAAVVLVAALISVSASEGTQENAGAPSDRAGRANGQEAGPGAGQNVARQDERSAGQPSGDDTGGTGSGGSGDSGGEAPANGASDSGSPGDGPIPERAQDPDVVPEPGEEIQKSHHYGEQPYVQAPEGEGADSAPAHENQPGSYDPLGRGAESDALTGTEEERARFAASSYVTYAYGYTGDELTEYRDGLSGTLLEEEFKDSPGQADIRAVEDDIKDGGLRSAAVLDEFDVRESSQEKIKGIAYFTVGEAYDGGGVSGETTSYAQPLNLQATGNGWTVAAADELEEV